MPSGARGATEKAGVDGSVDWTVLTPVYMRRGRAFAKGRPHQSRFKVDDVSQNELATYAAGRPGQDSLAACHSRAGTLASLLAEGAGLVVEGANLARECSVDHDRRAAEVNSLLSAWPADRVAVH